MSVQGIAKEQVAAQEAEVASLHAQIASAKQGFSSEPGAGTDVSYSRQRSEDIAIRLADNNPSLVTTRVQAATAHHMLLLLGEQTKLLRQADLIAPMDGVVWKLGTIKGNVLRPGMPFYLCWIVSASSFLLRFHRNAFQM